MKIRVFDRKNNAYALFQLGYAGGDKLFSVVSVLECIIFELYERQINFSFDKNRDNYEIEFIE